MATKAQRDVQAMKRHHHRSCMMKQVNGIIVEEKKKKKKKKTLLPCTIEGIISMDFGHIVSHYGSNWQHKEENVCVHYYTHG